MLVFLQAMAAKTADNFHEVFNLPLFCLYRPDMSIYNKLSQHSACTSEMCQKLRESVMSFGLTRRVCAGLL